MDRDKIYKFDQIQWSDLRQCGMNRDKFINALGPTCLLLLLLMFFLIIQIEEQISPTVKY